MSNPGRTPSRASTFRPIPPKRTLSSQFRQYRKSTLRNSIINDESTTRSYGTMTLALAESVPEEHEPLLNQGNDDAENVGNDHIDDDDQELEAQESDQADSDGLYPPKCTWTGNVPTPPRADPFGHSRCGVWMRIHEVRKDIMDIIDEPYSLEQLKTPRMNISLVRPLVDKYFGLQDLSIIYVLLINRTQFIREQSFASHHQTVNLTRALICELLSEKILRRYNEHNPGPLGLLKLANMLVAGFDPFQGAPPEVVSDASHIMHWAHQRKGLTHERKITALEIAIVSESKSFLACSACQKVVDAIYRGKIVYSPSSFIDIIPDHWKRRPISLYDPRRGPLLNQYRLIVPRTRNIVEVVQFMILLVLYILVMSGRETRRTTKFVPIEIVFDVYAGGWVLDQLASILEHGWQVYTQNLWSFLDVFSSILFIMYFFCRMHALTITDPDEAIQWAKSGLDILSCAAPVLIPRLAFNVMSENMLFLSLRAMMGDFLTLTGVAVWCFAGFLLSLKWLHNGLHQSTTIAKWMIWIWFGLDGTGIDRSWEFHSWLGPILMITFAFLGNTLFLTILVSMLTNTFSMIASNAVQEIQYRKAVLTFMGVKSDAIFAYFPPFNIAALFILLPAKFFLTPRQFHSLNVGAVRVINAPILLIISLYERRALWIPDRYRQSRPRHIDWKNSNGPRALNQGWWSRTFQFWDFSRFSVHGDIQAVFDLGPPEAYNEQPTEGASDVSPGPDTKKQDDKSNTKQDAPPSRACSSSSSSSNNAKSKSRPKSTIESRRKRTTDKTSALWQEFFDSEDDRKRDNPRSRPSSSSKGPIGKLARPERKDSIISSYDLTHPDSTEANIRLQRLEASMERMERLLAQVLGDVDVDGADADADADGEDEAKTQQELRMDYKRETDT